MPVQQTLGISAISCHTAISQVRGYPARRQDTGTDLKSNAEQHFQLAQSNCRSQVGALCWRSNRGVIEVLLVTSRDTGRWVIPKGWPMPDRSAAMAAAREAWEEAGVEGDIAQDALGLYTYAKRRLPDPPLPCAVSVFALHVTSLANRFPERKQRQRKWFAARKAARKVDEPELREIFLRVDQDPAILGPDLPALDQR